MAALRGLCTQTDQVSVWAGLPPVLRLTFDPLTGNKSINPFSIPSFSMKIRLNSLAAAVSFAALFGLTSCQKETLNEPQIPTTASTSDDARAKFVGKLYTLTKHDGNTLNYYRNGSLAKVVSTDESNPYHIDYTYGFQKIKAVSRVSLQNKIFNEINFQHDGKGRCTEAEIISYMHYVGGSYSTKTKTWKYDYDAKGYLKKSYSKTNAAEHFDYNFNAAGDLVKVTGFGTNGQADSEVTFAYEQPAGDIFADRHPLNPADANLHDTYLRIFGKPSKHLVKRQILKTLPGNLVIYDSFYSYLLNADGYVKQRQQYNVATAALLATVLYEYHVTVSL